MRFTLNISLNNAGALLEDDETVDAYAVAAYVRGVAEALEDYVTSGTVRDESNGPAIGKWAITEDETPARVPVDMDLFKSTAPAFNCIAYPEEGMHHRPYVPQGPRVCWWCGETESR